MKAKRKPRSNRVASDGGLASRGFDWSWLWIMPLAVALSPIGGIVLYAITESHQATAFFLLSLWLVRLLDELVTMGTIEANAAFTNEPQETK